MPNSSDKWKSFFADLGRPTKRGIRKCPKCGTVNGTRGNSCKNKACDVVFRDNGASKKSSTEACRIVTNIQDLQVFSARIRDRGPDYRNFVQLSISDSDSQSQDDDDANMPSTKCYVDSCVKNKEFPCSHVQAAYRCFSASEPLVIKQSSVPSLNIPVEHQQTISAFINEANDILVQRVSKTSFVVKCVATSKHPLGYLHIMFFKQNKDDGISEKKFLCTCKPFKPQNRPADQSSQQQQSSEVVETDFRFCLHYHACLCAFASDESLSAEFEYFLMQGSPACSTTLLSQLHLVTLPPPVAAGTIDGIDASSISVEIMQENISLLESIAAVDDGTLHNVQGLEGVLTDQIIVTNVEDALNFGDTSGLDLDESDEQVCQIFASGPGTIQLTGTFSTTDSIHQTVSITAPPSILNPPLVPVASGNKKRRQGTDDVRNTLMDGSSAQALASTSNLFQTTTPNLNPQMEGNFGKQGIKSSKLNSAAPSSVPSTLISPTLDSEMSEAFEFWLSGVNERLNAVMNYQFNGKPDSIIYYISTDYFDKLKERITYGIKKKRLPNQTVIITRTDKPPAGTFTKHVWKITNLIHVLQIFQNQIIPLKISQYFVKAPHGLYEEWVAPNDTDRKNQLIKPHLYSTYLKVGKHDPNGSEMIPFIIEWIPDILPQSKLGELTITFEFGHNTPQEEGVSSNKIAKSSRH